MFLFQAMMGAERAAPPGAQADLASASRLFPGMEKIVKSALADPGTQYRVQVDGKERMWTLAEMREYVKTKLGALKDENALGVLQRDIYGFDDREALKLLQSQVPWATENSLKELKESKGNATFKAILGSLCSNDWMIDNLLQAEITTSNVGNNGDSMNPIGMQGAISGIKATLVVDSYAFSSLDKATSGKTIAIKAAGRLGEAISFEIDPQNLNHICTEINSSVLTASCSQFDFASSVYLGATPEEAKESLIETGTKNAEKRATTLFGRSFVSNISALVTESVREFLASRRTPASQETLSSFIINQLQMLNTINDMKENNEFVQNISNEERKKRDARGGFT